MATKKTPLTEDDALGFPAADTDFDQAVDDLRGVLKNDAEGTLPGIGSDFGAEFDMSPSAGSSFDADLGSDFGGGDFGAGGFGGMDAGGSTSASISEPGSALSANMDLIMDIPIDVQIVLGSSRMQVSGLMNLEEGAIIALDRKIGEPVEIMVNGRRIARGEITVLENDDTRFGVKLIEVLTTKTH
jgi:flagellar motor switch protein FliN